MKYHFLALFLCYSLFSIAQQTVEDDFEGDGTITTWFGDDCGIDLGFSNPFQTGINTSNTVLKYTDVGGSYANIRFDTSSNFDLSTDRTFSLKIYVPTTSITGSQTNQISLKLQNGSLGSPWSTQTEIIKPIVLDQWQTVSFDFANDTYINLDANSDAPINRTDFSRVLLQINGEDNNDQVIAYIDDFLYDGTIDIDTGSGTDPVFDNLVWSDEFDGNGAINATNWFHQIIPILDGQTNWANGEIQHYTERTDNSYVDNGTLKILAKKETYSNADGVTKEYTSARLNSKFAFTYGKVEIKAKMPFGVGTFPALWMLGQNITENGGYWAPTHGTTGWPDCGEVDIIEHWGSNQDFVQSALHNRSSFGGTINKGGRTIVGASTQFHIYTLEWSSEKMVFKVDGIVHYTYNPDNKNIENWPYDAPQYLLFNVAILPNIASTFTESAMEIDYVRVYQESATASIEGINNLNNVEIYPNPIKDKTTIKIQPNLFGVKGTLYSILGKKITSFVQNSSEKEYDFSMLKKGIYILKFDLEEESSTYKVLKM